MAVRDTSRPGLRERSKVRRRGLILHTALRLFAERGYDRTTIADIAEVAEVAPRTVTGYFPSKLDFVLDRPAGLADRLVAAFNQHPGADFLELVDLWWRDARETMDPEEGPLILAMARNNPGVVAMADAQVSQRMIEGGYSLGAYTGRAQNDLVQIAARAAIHTVNLTYFQGVDEGRMTDDLHKTLLTLVRTIADAAKIR